MYSSACDDVEAGHLGIDEAMITVSSQLSVSVWSQSDQCYEVRLDTVNMAQFTLAHICDQCKKLISL